ncbi:MAG: dihydrofolate reductase [Clostridia bacterium]|nr:dihydrofolate reductase [Clostridia bacterium]
MKFIVAVDKEWGIGNKGDLLARVRADLANFRRVTAGKVVVYGSNTLATFPGGKVLPKRTNIVLNWDMDYHPEGATVAHSLDELFEILKQYDTDDVFVIGGASMYRQLIPYCDTGYITFFEKSYEKDVYIPDLDKDPEWIRVSRSETYVSDETTDTEGGLEFYFTEYRRVKRDADGVTALECGAPMTDEAISEALDRLIGAKKPRKALILPPDHTRLYSGGGKITDMLWHKLKDSCEVDIMPALGTHAPMTRDEWEEFFGDIPFEKMIVHNWRTGVERVGEVPAEFVKEVSEGIMNEPVPVEINRRLLDKSYDLIISVGQVVPHEVVGMANYSKNIFVGCGGSGMINASHSLGAFYGMERIMGRDHSPVRKVFDYAEEHFIADLPVVYVLTVCAGGGKTDIRGLYIGRDRSLFERAVAQSRKINLDHLKKPIDKAVVMLDKNEFRSTWLGNKAIYRLRMAMAEGGELVIIAPGVNKFGEDAENDRLIRKYGYCGREKVLELVKSEPELRANLSAAAHLIHGSADGKFRVTYCAGGLTEQEIDNAGFGYMPPREAMEKYRVRELKDGWNDVDGEEVFYVSNPALGLWIFDGEEK